MSTTATLAYYLASGLGSLALPYPVVYAVVRWRRGHEIVIGKKRAAAWAVVATALMAVFQAIADGLGAVGELSRLLLAIPIPIVVSWLAIMLSASAVARPALSPAEEMRAIRPK